MSQIVSLGILAFILLELSGRIYFTYDVVKRDDLSPDQMLVYLFLFWGLVFTWIIYSVLGTERTSELFEDLI